MVVTRLEPSDSVGELIMATVARVFPSDKDPEASGFQFDRVSTKSLGFGGADVIGFWHVGFCNSLIATSYIHQLIISP